jgi:hypothetical protein
MADTRQYGNLYLTVHRPIVTVDYLKLSFRIERNQALTWFPFLILKKLLARRRARHTTLAKAAGHFLFRTERHPKPVDNFGIC